MPPNPKSEALDAKRIWGYATRFQDKLIFSIPDNEHLIELKALFNLWGQLVKALKTLNAAHANASHNPACIIAENIIRTQTEVQLKQQIKICEQYILTIVEADDQLSQNFQLITSIPGVGFVTAIEMIITTNKFNRIKSARKAVAYAGVCAYPNQGVISLKSPGYTSGQIRS